MAGSFPVPGRNQPITAHRGYGCSSCRYTKSSMTEQQRRSEKIFSLCKPHESHTSISREIPTTHATVTATFNGYV